ncbi:hypothetical protein KEM52_006493, partial [Ascosphaera acerosa]
MKQGFVFLALAGSVLAQQATQGGAVWANTVAPTPVVTDAPEIGAAEPGAACKTYRVLSVCSSRTLNPTYTPATPLPSDWLWGCPPDKQCKPRSGPPGSPECNFEVGPPGPDYVCSPDECVDLPKPIEQPEWVKQMNKVVVSPDYWNLDPRQFNLTFEEAFLWLGEDGKSYYPVTAIGNVPTYETLSASSYITVPGSTVTSTMTVTTTAASVVAAVAEELRRRALKVPADCWNDCDEAYTAGQYEKKSDGLCKSDSIFQQAKFVCSECIKEADEQSSSALPNGFEVLLKKCGQKLRRKHKRAGSDELSGSPFIESKTDFAASAASTQGSTQATTTTAAAATAALTTGVSTTALATASSTT